MDYFTFEPSTKIILKIVFAGLALAFLWVVRDVVMILLFSLVLASAMEPLVGYFHEKKVPRSVSVLVLYVLIFSVVGVIIALLIPPLISQMQTVQARLPEIVASLQTHLPWVFSGTDGAQISKIITQVLNAFNSEGSLFTQTVGVFNGLFAFVTVMVISFYLVVEDKSIRKFIHALVPSGQQEVVVHLIQKFQHKMGRWVLGQLLLSVSIFVLTFIGLSILGVEYALFLALLAGLLEVVPYIGPFLSAVPAIFFAFLQSPPLALAVLVLYIVIQKTEGYVLVPKIMEKTVGTTPLVVLVALLMGLKLAGIFGLLLAVPVVSAITVVVDELSKREGG